MLVRSQNFGQMSSHRVFIEENLLHLVTVRNKPLGCCFPAVKQLLRVSGSPESTYPPIASFCPGNVLWLRAHLPTEDQNLMKKLILHLEISSAVLTSLWSTVDLNTELFTFPLTAIQLSTISTTSCHDSRIKSIISSLFLFQSIFSSSPITAVDSGNPASILRYNTSLI